MPLLATGIHQCPYWPLAFTNALIALMAYQIEAADVLENKYCDENAQ